MCIQYIYIYIYLCVYNIYIYIFMCIQYIYTRVCICIYMYVICIPFKEERKNKRSSQSEGIMQNKADV